MSESAAIEEGRLGPRRNRFAGAPAADCDKSLQDSMTLDEISPMGARDNLELRPGSAPTSGRRRKPFLFGTGASPAILPPGASGALCGSHN